MRYLILAIVLLVAACGDVDRAPDRDAAPQVSTTAATTTQAPPAVSTTSATESPEATTTTSTTTTTQPPRPLDEVSLVAVEAGSGFTQPVLMLTAPGDPAWYVVDQPGIVWVVDGGEAEVFLDINDLVRFDGEQGLLGMAFAPDYTGGGLVFLNYTDNDGDTVVASVRASGNRADRDTLTAILRVDQPAANHNGGMIEFGPDGNLWIGFGDGGGANDQFGQGQRADTMLGAMVRIAAASDGYSIPSGNLEEEVWATGLRNPWRFTFDGDDLWIADVGQNRIEEVDVVQWRDGNPNFGWSVYEGTECFGGGECDPAGFVVPIYEYTHSEGCSVTGGFVYRGSAIPELSGQYFFSDYCTGWLRSVTRTGEMREWLPAGTFSLVIGFGRDSAGELYVLDRSGQIFAIVEG